MLKRRVCIFLLGFWLLVSSPATAQTICPGVTGSPSTPTRMPEIAGLVGPTQCTVDADGEPGSSYDAIGSSNIDPRLRFLALLPDDAPRSGATHPAVFVFSPSGGTSRSPIAAATCPGGTVTGVGATVVSITLADGASCSLTLTSANGAGGTLMSFTATLSRTGNVYATSTGTLTGDAFGGTVPSPLDPRQRTVEVISRFMTRRADLLLSNGPDARRQIDRLNAAAGPAYDSQDATDDRVRIGALDRPVSDAIQSARVTRDVRPSSPAANGVVLGPDRLSFAASLSRSGWLDHGAAMAVGRTEGTAAIRPTGRRAITSSAFDVWVEGQYRRFAGDPDGSGRSDGHFGLVYVGADYVVGPSLLVGALVQIDSMKETSVSSAASISGRGWMAGPYATLRLSKDVFLQARAAFGRSDNQVSPFLSYTDSFGSERWLATTTLQGRWHSGAWQVRPSATLAFLRDRSEGYVDSTGATIPSVTVSLGQLKVGPELTYTHRMADGTILEPRIGVEAIWNFAASTAAADFGGTLSGPEALRGRIELGLVARLETGASLGVSASYDGLFASDFMSVGAMASLHLPLN
jgi:hypothetical protein